MVSYLNRFLQDGIEPSTLLTTKGGAETSYRLCSYLHSHSGGSTPSHLWYEYDTTQRTKISLDMKFPGAYPKHLATWEQLQCGTSLNGSDPRDAYHPGGTGTGQNRTVRKLCRMLLPLRLQQRLPCGPHGPGPCLWHLCMPTPTKI
jgi:hypothetical protein